MPEFLTNWGIELILGILSSGVMGILGWYISKLKKQLKLAEEYTQTMQQDKIEDTIEDKTKPIYQELENLRSYVRDYEIKSDKMWALVIDSYKFRLVELCKIHLNNGYMTQDEFDQLTEFYKLYTGLGGNGQAKQYYDKASALEIRQ